MIDPGETMTLTPAQLAMLLEGIDWRPRAPLAARRRRLRLRQNLTRIGRYAWSRRRRRCVDSGMRFDLDEPAGHVAILHQLVRDMAPAVERPQDRPRSSGSRRSSSAPASQFGRRSERLDPDQLQLGLEDLDADIARVEERSAGDAASDRARSSRPTAQALPDICRARRC